MATFEIQERSYSCPVELSLSVVGGKWTALVLWHLRGGTRRYSELRRALPGITHKMLAQRLRELEADGLVHREAYPVVPPRTEYSLTAEGERMIPALEAMKWWGMRYKSETEEET